MQFEFNQQDLKVIELLNQHIDRTKYGSCTLYSALFAAYLNQAYPKLNVDLVGSYVNRDNYIVDYHTWLEVRTENKNDGPILIDMTVAQFNQDDDDETSSMSYLHRYSDRRAEEPAQYIINPFDELSIDFDYEFDVYLDPNDNFYELDDEEVRNYQDEISYKRKDFQSFLQEEWVNDFKQRSVDDVLQEYNMNCEVCSRQAIELYLHVLNNDGEFKLDLLSKPNTPTLKMTG